MCPVRNVTYVSGRSIKYSDRMMEKYYGKEPMDDSGSRLSGTKRPIEA
jgi:hypothetical protein